MRKQLWIALVLACAATFGAMYVNSAASRLTTAATHHLILARNDSEAANEAARQANTALDGAQERVTGAQIDLVEARDTMEKAQQAQARAEEALRTAEEQERAALARLGDAEQLRDGARRDLARLQAATH